MNNETTQIGGIAADALRQFIGRIENLAAERKALSEDVKEVYALVKSQGFEPKIVRKIVSLRKKDRAEREEEDQILELYLASIGET